MSQLAASELPLHKIFCSDYDFVIPHYQRPYAWGPDEATQLLEDLAEALDRDNGEPYFMGSVVLVKADGRAPAEVIDGQQRLTTLTLLLAVLRDLADDPDIAKGLQDSISEPGIKFRGLEPKPRLALRAREREFFRDRVQTAGRIEELCALRDDRLDTDAKRNLRDNASALRDRLAGWPDDRRTDLARLLADRTFLVVVSTSDLESAYRIFRVMNSRGLDLSPADIFKAEVIGKIPDDAKENYSAKWETAEQELGRDRFSDLFLHLRLIHSHRRAELNLLREFPVQVLASYLPDRAREFVDEVLVPYAHAYRQMDGRTYAASAGAEKVNGWLKRLAQLDTTDWQTPALWALREHGDDPAWLDRFMRKLERLAATMFIQRQYVTLRLARYIDLLRQLAAGDGLDAKAFEVTDAEKIATLKQLDGRLYEVTKIRKYVLLRLDELLANSSVVTYDHPIVTVEHVLPQHPGPDSRWRETFDDEARERWTHHIANLVLLSREKNSEAQNFDFEEKKQRYFTGRRGVTAFVLTTGVLMADEWTPKVLQERRETILATLTREWLG